MAGTGFHYVVANRAQMCTADFHEENNFTADRHEENNRTSNCHEENIIIIITLLCPWAYNRSRLVTKQKEKKKKKENHRKKISISKKARRDNG
jgi:hypothetical protein